MNEIQKIDFHGNPISVIVKDGKQYVAMKPIVEAMGLDWDSQRQMIQRDEVLGKGACVIHVPSKGGNQETVCLPLNKLNGWLFKIPASRYSGKRKEAIIRYQEECYDVLYNYFHDGGIINPGATEQQLAKILAKFEEERKILLATAQDAIYQKVESEYRERMLKRQLAALTTMKPDCEFGELSNATGLPRDILVKCYLKSNRKRHSPDFGKYIQLILPLDTILNGCEVTQFN